MFDSACNRISLLVDCVWRDWSLWSTCSHSCGQGNQARNRTTLIDALYGGENCTGSTKDTKQCNVKPCPGNFEYIYYTLRKRLIQVDIFPLRRFRTLPKFS